MNGNTYQENHGEPIVNGNNEPLQYDKEYHDVIKTIDEITCTQRKDKEIARYGINNRILVLGSCGCGETSLLRYFSEHLPLESNEKDEEDGEDKSFCVVKYYCLPIIVPCSFENSIDVLVTVITSMFSEAKRKMALVEDTGDAAIREELLKQFEIVLKSLKTIKSEMSSYTLESLNQRSDAENLREQIKQLVNGFLKHQGCEGESRLVLLIDDIDMTMSAPEMLEQMRKYLELDNLIILMTAEEKQLINVIKKRYYSAFQGVLNNGIQALSIDVDDLATKYLLKLFPMSRRVSVG